MKDIYVKFEGATELQGDSTDTKHANEIEVSKFVRQMLYWPDATNQAQRDLAAFRYKHLLYAVVDLVIAVLMVLQDRVIRRIDP